ncbi:peptide-methionine (R)-S-oxide reductase MsrB [Fulvimonas sp. R45]|uniref:peptide-methionine (R)-S-oxide reductase MsrB n=1 Tax=Fulvimonas sp. R45 TaxID=3045937 RepID=UPI00265E24EE|nr:peptide-methionine (R)-S-oxide reductase MsrB [Fulvimonas sp. R45]MDO1529545.1 peptide-methionine (R)-S-oxide reductase MsrB [Fulvimonas sp. R45]
MNPNSELSADSPPVRKTDAQWQAELTPEQYAICRCAATEPPFSGRWYLHRDAGTYTCVACAAPLFASAAKYDAGCGWPSFFQPLAEAALSRHADDSLGMRRTEVRCARCGSHLGHLFEDGPPPTGLRYCINSVALGFAPA